MSRLRSARSLSRLSRLSLVCLALVAPASLGGCTKAAEGTPPDGDQAAQAGANEAGGAIAGTPIDGGGKLASVAGGGADNDKPFTVEVVAGEGTVGEAGQVSIKVVPAKNWHLNLEYPTKLELAPPAGVELAKANQSKEDAVSLTEAGCEFAVTYTASEAGAKQFDGEIRFAVCEADACVPKAEKLAFEVAVK